MLYALSANHNAQSSFEPSIIRKTLPRSESLKRYTVPSGLAVARKRPRESRQRRAYSTSLTAKDQTPGRPLRWHRDPNREWFRRRRRKQTRLARRRARRAEDWARRTTPGLRLLESVQIPQSDRWVRGFSGGCQGLSIRMESHASDLALMPAQHGGGPAAGDVPEIDCGIVPGGQGRAIRAEGNARASTGAFEGARRAFRLSGPRP